MPAHIHGALTSTRVAAAITKTGLRSFASHAPDPIAVRPTNYVVASTIDLTQRTDVLADATTYYQAQVALASHLVAHPEDEADLQVIASHEAAPEVVVT